MPNGTDDWEDFEDEYPDIDEYFDQFETEEDLLNAEPSDRVLDSMFGSEIYDQHPELEAYKPRVERVLNHISSEHDLDPGTMIELYESMARTLEVVPENIGHKILSRANKMTTGLETRLEGVFQVAQTPEFHDKELFDFVMDKVSRVNDKEYSSIVRSLRSIASQVKDDKGDDRFSDHVDAFILGISNRGSQSPEKLYDNIVSSSYLADLIIKSKGKVSEVPEHLEHLFIPEDRRSDHINMLLNLPGTRHLESHRFLHYAIDSKDRKFFKNWIGANASAGRVKLYDKVFYQVGVEGATKLGKPLLNALSKKVKEDPDIINEVFHEGIRQIYEAIPSKNKSPPKWMVGLRKKIDGTPAGNVLEVIVSEVGDMPQRRRNAEREKELRTKYSDLVKKIPKAKPIQAGHYTAGDVLLTLDEELLTAMNSHEGKKTGILNGIGNDLKAANRAYRQSGLTSYAMITLLDGGTNLKRIRAIGRSLSDEQKEALRKVEGNAFESARKMYQNPDSLEERIGDFESFEDREFEILAAASPVSDDPIGYVANLSDTQRNAVSYILNNGPLNVVESTKSFKHTENVVRDVDPSNVETYADLMPERFVGDPKLMMDDFSAFIGTFKGANAINATLETYRELSEEERERLDKGYENGLEKGIVLRVFKTPDAPQYQTLKDDWKRYNHGALPISSAVESKLEKFCSFYETMETPTKIDFLLSINKNQGNFSMDESMDLALQYGEKTPEYLTLALDLIGTDLPKGRALELAKEENVARKYLEVDENHRKLWLNFIKEEDLAFVRDHEKYVDLPLSDFYLAAQAWHFAHNNQMEGEYKSGFNDSLEQGTVGPWSQTIIDHFREDTKGGGIYRDMKGLDREVVVGGAVA